MITISWNQLDEHIDKGDLKEWLNDELHADKLRQFEEDQKETETTNEVSYEDD